MNWTGYHIFCSRYLCPPTYKVLHGYISTVPTATKAAKIRMCQMGTYVEDVGMGFNK